MHEIPNFPFPSLHEQQQTALARRESGQLNAMKAAPKAQQSQKASGKN
ncbi:hypothetical protein ACCD10_22675 [Pseudomonas sp. Pseusp122]|jgi:hypothetical protein